MKVLFTGLGSIGQRHLRNLRKLIGDSVEVLAYRVLREVPMLNDQLQVYLLTHQIFLKLYLHGKPYHRKNMSMFHPLFVKVYQHHLQKEWT